MKPFPLTTQPPAASIDPAYHGLSAPDLMIQSAGAQNMHTSVHQVVSQLITSLQPLAVRRNNVLLNDIPRELLAYVDSNMLAYVLTQMVNSAVAGTENRCIHIEAIPSGHHTMIRVKDMDTHIYHTMDLNG